MALENPFRESRLNNSRNYRHEWDIAELNQGLTNQLVNEVKSLRGRRDPDPGQMILTVTGPPGYGKTHLFGRIEHQVGHEVFFAFIPEFGEQTPPLDHIRRHAIEALFDAPERGYSPLEMALARTCRPAFASYFAELPPTLAARHETLTRRLDALPEAVLEIVGQVKTLGPFLKLADSMTRILPHDAGVIRALALGWAPAPWSWTARRWLMGQDVSDPERIELGLGEDSPRPIEVLQAIGAIFDHDRPMMICCDQVEGILKGKNEAAINRLTTSLIELLQSVPCQIVFNCFRDTWDDFLKVAFTAFKMRVRQPAFRLEVMKPEQAVRLVQSRMASWSGRTANQPPTWPFLEASIEHLVRDQTPTPRGLIQLCDSRFDTWIAAGGEGEIDLAAGIQRPVDDTPTLFLKEWNQEIAAISQDPKRSADYLAEDRLYAGILEALKLAQSVQRMREFGGVRIVDVQDKVVKATAPNRRPGARIAISGGPGQDAQPVIVALTSIEASNKLGPYFNALFKAADDPRANIVLIHPKRDLDLGPAARSAVDRGQKEGRLRLMPLEDYPLSHRSTECLITFINRAVARELVINNVTLSAEDCRDLVLKTGVIDNLDLFKMLGRWKPSATRVVTAAPSSSPNVAAPPIEPSISYAPVEPASTREPDPVPASTAPASSVEVGLESWAEKKLAGAVKKLNLLGQDVEPDGFEVGPTFARLRVRPVRKTNFKGVCNKAVDLRISLGLEVVPIVGSQAGCISIDVQRPDRAVVSLETALADPPANLVGMPAFPVGLDVAGQSHWLNLAEPSDCHLLVAGTTGSGKSEFLRAMIAALAARLGPDQLQFLLVDPKRVTFNLQAASPYLRAPVAYGLEEAFPLIQQCMAEMDARYAILEKRKLSNVSELNAELLPRIVLVIDEFASFLEDKDSKKLVTALLKRIGAMARAAGIHLILSTQRPDKDVITPVLRENLPGRIALKVSSKAGSDLILGSPDAENLLGKGDLFWKKGGELLRLQSPFVLQAELERRLKVHL